MIGYIRVLFKVHVCVYSTITYHILQIKWTYQQQQHDTKIKIAQGNYNRKIKWHIPSAQQLVHMKMDN